MVAQYPPWIVDGKLIKRRYSCPSDTFLQERIITLIKENQQNVLKEQEQLDKLEIGSLKIVERFHTEFIGDPNVTSCFVLSPGQLVDDKKESGKVETIQFFVGITVKDSDPSKVAKIGKSYICAYQALLETFASLTPEVFTIGWPSKDQPTADIQITRRTLLEKDTAIAKVFSLVPVLELQMEIRPSINK
jgi:hypothetical protein